MAAFKERMWQGTSALFYRFEKRRFITTGRGPVNARRTSGARGITGKIRHASRQGILDNG